jgi:NADH:ubiquinone oxidoreductase subunit H
VKYVFKTARVLCNIYMGIGIVGMLWFGGWGMIHIIHNMIEGDYATSGTLAGYLIVEVVVIALFISLYRWTRQLVIAFEK